MICPVLLIKRKKQMHDSTCFSIMALALYCKIYLSILNLTCSSLKIKTAPCREADCNDFDWSAWLLRISGFSSGALMWWLTGRYNMPFPPVNTPTSYDWPTVALLLDCVWVRESGLDVQRVSRPSSSPVAKKLPCQNQNPVSKLIFFTEGQPSVQTFNLSTLPRLQTQLRAKWVSVFTELQPVTS